MKEVNQKSKRGAKRHILLHPKHKQRKFFWRVLTTAPRLDCSAEHLEFQQVLAGISQTVSIPTNMQPIQAGLCTVLPKDTNHAGGFSLGTIHNPETLRNQQKDRATEKTGFCGNGCIYIYPKNNNQTKRDNALDKQINYVKLLDTNEI